MPALTMETWVLHHPSRTIHRLPLGGVVPGHVSRMSLAEISVLSAQVCDKQRDLCERYRAYHFCSVCAAAARRLQNKTAAADEHTRSA